jgi:HEAT repeat protein
LKKIVSAESRIKLVLAFSAGYAQPISCHCRQRKGEKGMKRRITKAKFAASILGCLLILGCAAKPTTMKNAKKYVAKQNVEKLISLLYQYQTPEVREYAIESLAKIKDKRAVKPLSSALVYRAYPIDTRKKVAWVLGEFGDARAVEALITVLKEERDILGGDAAWALGKIKDARAVEPLVAVLKDSTSIGWSAAWALGEIGDARAVEPLIATLEDDKEIVRGDAARALGEIGDTRAVEPLIAALRDESKYVRKRTATALGEIKDDRAVEPLIAALRNDPSIAWNAAWALGELKAHVAVKFLIDALDDDPSIGWCAARSLGKIKDARAVEPLIDALKGDPSIVWCAGRSLGEITGEDFGEDPEKWKRWWQRNKKQFLKPKRSRTR